MNSTKLESLLRCGPCPSQLKELVRDIDFFTTPSDVHTKVHSKALDKILGFKIPKVEQNLLKKYRAFYKKSDDSNKKKHYEGTQTWIGLHPQVLQTPYTEIATFLSILEKYNPKKLVDLGAGYGRVGVVMNAVIPDASFVGYEILAKRIQEAERMFEVLGLDNCQMINQNILDSDFKMPKADVYFIYDFSDPGDLRQILGQLSEKLYNDRFFIIAKGEGIRSLIQLKYPEFWAAHGVIHDKDWSLYSSFCDLD